MIEIKKTVLKEVEETIKLDLKPRWMVRVLKPNGNNTYFVEYQEEFEYKPDEQAIASILAEHQKHSNSFASVFENYYLEEVKESED